MTDAVDARPVDGAELGEGQGRILSVRALPGANCSSVGSVIDLLFAASVAGGALLVAVTAALTTSPGAGAPLEETPPADDDAPRADGEGSPR